ncbi:bifunctional heptose 7-phosphate kinase/heptose 1-phosphate adenyltransferase [Flammeovirga kamogawensis]|uniref:D-glycero-beta-D-manno-heptose-7-phosphate kinase n=1 Tax=Flammeovirga kamogawensis TaxID=373891 RepID=A0ABX8GQW8_9BACT|nr:bifunctional ADP-heptose synthase [Flammeovirga kamogawensis]MBB6462104.1 rfaE bifunctional protein kinase chain/domain [Flammeovirga kamogawensis]QWG05838.1 D-glycero-beta-D-manno-heptose-7-phosphate kinase [Flammeovirga kamogawensis]TRX67663.1 D-glycero-beta-D-manno-heptose-7-phosphate kinase [Flammeovirga kamogawensis]
MALDIKEALEKFNGLKALVIGDVMIDSYIWGNVDRISPEAPVPIVDVNKKESRMGGAANVAKNLHFLGAEPILCAVIGNDAEAETFLGLCDNLGISRDGLIQSTERITTVKHRVIASAQHVLRIDNEDARPLKSNDTSLLLERIKKLADDADVIIFEDYDKGVITPTLITEVVKIASEKGIPTTVDPKKRNFLDYVGVTLFKPNLKEMREGLKFDFDGNVIDEVKAASQELKAKMENTHTMVTLSEHGVYITDHTNEAHIPAHKREIADVSGAGDTVISIASLALAIGLPMEKVAALANLGGGLVCEHVGVVPIDKQKLLEEASKKL